MLRGFLLLVIGVIPFWPPAATASLGGNAASVLSDSDVLRGTVHPIRMVAYEVDEIVDAAGLRVREFVNRDGAVFALSWSGPVPPDLQQLLGQFFGAYAAALAGIPHPGLRRSVRIAQPTLVIESGGHLRAYSGRAYLPALMPTEIQVSDIR